jgi:hypothetical protein
MQYEPVLEALKTFKFAPRNGRPTARHLPTVKGFWGFSSFLNSQRQISEALMTQEMSLQEQGVPTASLNLSPSFTTRNKQQCRDELQEDN